MNQTCLEVESRANASPTVSRVKKKVKTLNYRKRTRAQILVKNGGVTQDQGGVEHDFLFSNSCCKAKPFRKLRQHHVYTLSLKMCCFQIQHERNYLSTGWFVSRIVTFHVFVGLNTRCMEQNVQVSFDWSIYECVKRQQIWWPCELCQIRFQQTGGGRWKKNKREKLP